MVKQVVTVTSEGRAYKEWMKMNRTSKNKYSLLFEKVLTIKGREDTGFGGTA